ncbi:MAG: L,D-transpeptidase [Myxococcales bacterium]|nr:L,D-transpeptidase [Myxococcales bacterium]
MRPLRPTSARALLALTLLWVGAGCDPVADEPAPPAEPVERPPEPEPARKPPMPEPPPMLDPVPLWDGGKSAREVDAAAAMAHGQVIVDLGEAWTPYLFTEGPGALPADAPEDAEPEILTNGYRTTYLNLARGSFPDDHHGERAKNDKYLELYGIMPTLDLLRIRFREAKELGCAEKVDITALKEFEGLITYRSNDAARKKARDFLFLRNQVNKYLEKQGVQDPAELDREQLEDREKDRLKRYLRQAPDWYAVAATQDRLKCEGYFKDRGRPVRGALDWTTHDALAEFERRHRVYSWGYLGRDTLKVLRMDTLEAERSAVIRVLTERAIHASGVIEDGSILPKRDGSPRTYTGADGKEHEIPNLVADLEQRVIEAFGLQTPESTLAWLEGLGELPVEGHRYVAIQGPELPEYYDGNMELTLDYDRGDVWYDFPYDTEGKQRAQPVERRPRVSLSTRYLGKRVPLARFGTTIGGWRSEKINETVMWKYKDSPIGSRVWSRIVASPVWLPPDSTPPRDLLKRRRNRKKGEPRYQINYHETGPSYASAYGLVAAYHRKYMERGSGRIEIGGDEGIRTHGSVDYMSIMRRHSHGCHRLHNHIAVRLMSFVLAHRPHYRVGQQPLAFKKTIEYEEETYNLDLKHGGYVFELEKPLKVRVHEGRIRGKLKEPIPFGVPKYDSEIGAYVTPDGGAVEVRGNQLVDVPMPVPDGGVPEALTDSITPPPAPPMLPPARVLPPAPTRKNTGNPRIRGRSFFGKPES